MNATNRIMNRTVLLLTGLVLAVGGLIALAFGVRPAWAEPWIQQGNTALVDLGVQMDALAVRLPDGTIVPGAVVVAFIVAIVIALATTLFLATRGGGRISDVLRHDDDKGRTSVDRNVADAILREPLVSRTDVLAVRTHAYRVSGARAVALGVTVRKGAPLDDVLAAADVAVQQWDRLAGTELPVVVHFEDTRWRDGMRTRTRVH